MTFLNTQTSCPHKIKVLELHLQIFEFLFLLVRFIHGLDAQETLTKEIVLEMHAITAPLALAVSSSGERTTWQVGNANLVLPKRYSDFANSPDITIAYLALENPEKLQKR